jgi:hypothetical protein
MAPIVKQRVLSNIVKRAIGLTLFRIWPNLRIKKRSCCRGLVYRIRQLNSCSKETVFATGFEPEKEEIWLTMKRDSDDGYLHMSGDLEAEEMSAGTIGWKSF